MRHEASPPSFTRTGDLESESIGRRFGRAGRRIRMVAQLPEDQPTRLAEIYWR